MQCQGRTMMYRSIKGIHFCRGKLWCPTWKDVGRWVGKRTGNVAGIEWPKILPKRRRRAEAHKQRRVAGRFISVVYYNQPSFQDPPFDGTLFFHTGHCAKFHFPLCSWNMGKLGSMAGQKAHQRARCAPHSDAAARKGILDLLEKPSNKPSLFPLFFSCFAWFFQ